MKLPFGFVFSRIYPIFLYSAAQPSSSFLRSLMADGLIVLWNVSTIEFQSLYIVDNYSQSARNENDWIAIKFVYVFFYLSATCLNLFVRSAISSISSLFLEPPYTEPSTLSKILREQLIILPIPSQGTNDVTILRLYYFKILAKYNHVVVSWKCCRRYSSRWSCQRHSPLHNR